MSAYSTLRDAIYDKIVGLVGSTLPQDTVVYKGMSLERFMQENRVIAVNVTLVDMSASDSELLGPALFQPETWLWDVQVSSMGATAHDDGAERAWTAIDAIRLAFCPADGWKPESYSDVMMFGGVASSGWTAAGAAVFSARFRHYRNMG